MDVKKKTIRYFAEPEEAKPDIKLEEKLKIKDYHDLFTYTVKLPKRQWGRKREELSQSELRKQRYPPRPKIDPEVLKKYSRGSGVRLTRIDSKLLKRKWKKKEKTYKYVHEQAARAEILLTEEPGFLEVEEGENTLEITQKDIVSQVDITAATKHFELKLNDFGPYRMKYTRNGRHLLLGGKQGHVAAFDWVTKKLHCEINVMETVHDICWMHIETMFAVAQKSYVYMYDKKGIELHCVKKMGRVNRMEFLPYHFLLASANEEGYINWLDISIGQLVANYNTKLGRLSLLTQNPYNGVLCMGHSKGVVSMWAPSTPEPLAKMLCHTSALTAIDVDPQGLYMATSSVTKEIKIWDIRKLEGPVRNYKVHHAPTDLNFSQKGLLAVALGNCVDIYKDSVIKNIREPYLRHKFNKYIGNVKFCPFEDVLGVATTCGFTSLLVPGAGEPNFDALECNPYQTTSQRKEYEVKALLEKIPAELITLDPNVIAEVDIPSAKEKHEMKEKQLYVKPPKVDYTPRKKGKGRGGAVNIARNKKIVQELAKKDFIKEQSELKVKENEKIKKEKWNSRKTGGVLDRFLPKK